MHTWQRIRNSLAERLAGDRREAPRRAIASAFAAFARQHPDWVEALFDEHFLSHGATALLSEYLDRRRAMPAAAGLVVNWRAPYTFWLAEAWARQAVVRSRAQRHARVAQAMSAANAFLLAVDEALAGPAQPAPSETRVRKGGVLFRPARASDVPALLAMHARLSAQSLYSRYLGPYRPTARDLERLCRLSELEGAMYVAETTGPLAEVVGYACYVRDADQPQVAEPAVLVEDRYQRRGLGWALLRQISQHARQNGIAAFAALVHHDNAAMLGLIESSGFAYTLAPDQDAVEVRLHLETAPGAQAVPWRAPTTRLAGEAI